MRWRSPATPARALGLSAARWVAFTSSVGRDQARYGNSSPGCIPSTHSARREDLCHPSTGRTPDLGCLGNRRRLLGISSGTPMYAGRDSSRDLRRDPPSSRGPTTDLSPRLLEAHPRRQGASPSLKFFKVEAGSSREPTVTPRNFGSAQNSPPLEPTTSASPPGRAPSTHSSYRRAASTRYSRPSLASSDPSTARTGGQTSPSPSAWKAALPGRPAKQTGIKGASPACKSELPSIPPCGRREVYLCTPPFDGPVGLYRHATVTLARRNARRVRRSESPTPLVASWRQSSSGGVRNGDSEARE